MQLLEQTWKQSTFTEKKSAYFCLSLLWQLISVVIYLMAGFELSNRAWFCFFFPEMLVSRFKFPPWTTIAWSIPECKFHERQAKSLYAPDPNWKGECINDMTIKLKRADLSYPIYHQIRFLPPVPQFCFEMTEGTIFPLVPFSVLSSSPKLLVLNNWNCLLGSDFYALITKEIQTRQRRSKDYQESKSCNALITSWHGLHVKHIIQTQAC